MHTTKWNRGRNYDITANKWKEECCSSEFFVKKILRSLFVGKKCISCSKLRRIIRLKYTHKVLELKTIAIKPSNCSDQIILIHVLAIYVACWWQFYVALPCSYSPTAYISFFWPYYNTHLPLCKWFICNYPE